MVRDGELSPEQREHLVTLLHTIATAAALAPHGAERYPDNPLQAATYSAAAGSRWAPGTAGCSIR
ncbi:MAG: hypothetical protein ACRDTT_07715 [Pseudonocardiaceae bacterium]